MNMLCVLSRRLSSGTVWLSPFVTPLKACAVLIIAIGAAAPALAQTLFFDDFTGPLSPAYSVVFPNPWDRTYLGASGHSFQALNGASVIRLQNVMGNASVRGWSSSSTYPSDGSIRLEARFNTMVQSSSTSIDEFMGLWIFDAANMSRFDYISLAAPGWGSLRYLYTYSSIAGGWLQLLQLNWHNNTWYRIVISGSPTQNVRLSIFDDTGTVELAGVDTGHNLTAYSSGFRFGLSQAMGAPGGAYPTDAAVDWLRLTRMVSDTQAPVVSNVGAAPNPGPVGTLLALTAAVSDGATGGSNITSAEYSIDGGPYSGMSAADGSFDSPTEIVQAALQLVSASVYSLCVRGRDAGNVSDPACTLLAVYDPAGGFVTGGGWVLSAPGAFAPDPAVTGKANFGFVSKYLPGASVPSGNTQFRFQTANLDFKSRDYEWLVVAGARAQFKGSGTINGAGDYGFLLTAIDGQVSGGGGVDRFRIKIWERASGEIVYDNQNGQPDSGDAATELGGGSIVIHKP